MAASFRQLVTLLDSFEQEQFELLCSRRLRDIPAGVAHGGVQFVSIERAASTIRTRSDALGVQCMPGDEKVLPVVVGIGINYCQQMENATYPKLSRWLRDKAGQPTIIDHEPHMRRATDLALAAYHRNSSAWTQPENGKPACAAYVPKLADYILVATNFCPLITTKQWAKHSSSERTALLQAAAVDLDRLATLISGYTDLWIGHGKEHWDRFHELRQSVGGMTSWMVTYNLSGLGAGNMIQRQRDGHPLYR